MFTIDISISLKCSAITLHCSGASHIDFVPSALKQRPGEEREAHLQNTRTLKSFCFALSLLDSSLSHRLRGGRLSVTFPSSMGLSLMCTTGPGCVLVDLRHAGNKKADKFTDQCSANLMGLMHLISVVQNMLSGFEWERKTKSRSSACEQRTGENIRGKCASVHQRERERQKQTEREGRQGHMRVCQRL